MGTGKYAVWCEYSDVLQINDKDGGIASIRAKVYSVHPYFAVEVRVREGFTFESTHTTDDLADFEYINITRN